MNPGLQSQGHLIFIKGASVNVQTDTTVLCVEFMVHHTGTRKEIRQNLPEAPDSLEGTCRVFDVHTGLWHDAVKISDMKPEPWSTWMRFDSGTKDLTRRGTHRREDVPVPGFDEKAPLTKFYHIWL